MHGEDEVVDDVIGVASARLLALGLPRGERLRALRLLGILGTVADDRGRVHRPLSLVASEFDLPVDEVDVWLDDLAAVGVVRVGDGVIELVGVEPMLPGLRLHDFLDAAAALDERPEAPTRRPLLLRPASALVAAAAVVALALAGPAIVDTDGTPASSTRDQPATPVVPTTADQVQPSASAPAPPVTSPTQVGPVLVPPTTIPELPCPTGLPVIDVLGTSTGLDGRLRVEGIARNPSGQPMVVRSFTLLTTVGGQEVTAPGIQRELVVPPDGTVLWQALLPVEAPAGTLVRATLGDWEWPAADVRSTCPSP